jgi:oxaloacetate decarboxylase alpha subunit
MSELKLIDVTIRDGNQSLWGGMGMSTSAVLPIAATLDRVGYQSLDFINSMMMWAAVKFHREDPWFRIREMAARMPNTPLGAITATQRFITWITPPAIHDLALQTMVRNGIRKFWITDPSNEMDKAIRLAKVLKDTGDVEVVVGVCYTLSPSHDDDYFVARARELANNPYIDAVYFKDAGGLLTPERVHQLAPKLRAALGSTPLREIHTHANTGLAPLSHLAALDEGITTFHTATAALANGTSHPEVVATVRNLRNLGHDIDIDLDAAAEVERHFRQIARRDGFPLGVPAAYDGSYYTHQVPGGMVSTMARQLSELGMRARLGEVLEEIPRVRAELGYPIMITPLSQFVGTQAMTNVVTGRRYSVIPDEIIYYVLGHFGPSAGPISPEVLDLVDRHPRKNTIADLMKFNDGVQTIADLRKRLGSSARDEEVVLRALMSDAEVDGIIPSSRESQENSALAPLRFLLEGLRKRPRVQQFHIQTADLQMTVCRD